MPSAASASFTASTLSGRTIAFNSLTLHPRSRRMDVRLFAVRHQIDADLLVGLRGAKREDERDYLQEHESQRATINDGGPDGDHLRDELSRIAEQESIGNPVQALLREDARQKRSDGAAQTVSGDEIGRAH